MDYSHRLEISYYKTIATINEEHRIYLVQHMQNHKIYIKKLQEVYNLSVYEQLKEHNITGIPQIVDYYEEDGKLLLIEEYISGISLQELMDTSRITLESIDSYICELCDILVQLHSLNPPMVHRDIKPSNILITPYNHVVLIDFNAAKYLTNKETPDTVLLGTKGYAAPEQYGFGSSTPKTDIYALGVLIKELVASLPEPTTLYDPIIEKCTQINPKERFETVTRLMENLPRKQEETLQATNTISKRLKPFMLPGYRTRNLWKMLLATPGYLMILWFSIDLDIKNTPMPAVWVQRICLLLMFLSVVFVFSNYYNIQRYMPLCRHKNFYLRQLGKILLCAIMLISLAFTMVLLCGLLTTP